MPKSDKALGQRVKEFRLMHAWTQEEAAVEFLLSYTTYFRVEHGMGCGDLTRAKIEKRIAESQKAA